MIRLNDLNLFTRVAALGSFTATANEADLDPAQVSAAVRRLERELGAPLVVRCRRSIRLTDEGRRYLPHAGNILSRIRESKDLLVADDDGGVQGALHIAIPTDLGRNLLVGWLAAFRTVYPDVRLQITVRDEDIDVFNEPFDAVIRYGTATERNHVTLPLALYNRRVLVASPDYLALNGEPRLPVDLLAHACLVDVEAGGTRGRWRFPGDGAGMVDVHAYRSSNDSELIRHWALAGDGIAYKSWLDVSSDVGAGRLKLLMPGVAGEPAPLHLVCAHRRQFLPAVRRLHVWMAEAIGAHLLAHPAPGSALSP